DGEPVPPPLVALAVRLCVPSPRAAARVILQLPPLSACTVGLRGVVPSKSCTVLPASAFPVIVGLLKLVRLSPAAPESVLASRVRPVGAGGGFGVAGTMVSVSAADAAETFPARSVAFAVMSWVPSDSGVRTAMLHAPVSRLIVPLPRTVVPSLSYRVTVVAKLEAVASTRALSARPLMVGVVTLVMLSPAVPVSEAGSRARLVGAASAVSRITSGKTLGRLAKMSATKYWYCVETLKSGVTATLQLPLA